MAIRIWVGQRPLQSALPAGHWQLPEMQACPSEQLLPQRPQLALSAEKETQASPQRLSPSAQMQAPRRQVSVVSQAFPQAPQLRALACVFTQVPSQ